MRDRAEIIVEGSALFPVNMLVRRKIRLRKVVYGGNRIRFTVSGKQLAECVKHLEEYNRKYEVVKKSGAGFFLSAARKRTGAIIGLIFFAAVTALYSRCVFGAEISGNKLIATEVISEKLSESVRLPTFNANFDIKKLEREIVSIDGISSASVRRTGTKLKIKVLEELPHISIDEIRAGFLPVKSRYDAMVTRLFVTHGTPLIKPGQAVRAGQTLIAPYLMQDEKLTVDSKAGGEVYGRVCITKRQLFFPEYIEFYRTGNSVTEYDIKPLNWLKKIEVPYKFYEIQSKTVYMGGIVPIKAVRNTYYETAESQVPFDFDGNSEAIIKEAIVKLENELPEGAVKLRNWHEVKRVDKIIQLDIYYEIEIRIN